MAWNLRVLSASVLSKRDILLLNPPGLTGSWPNREGAVGLGALSDEGGFIYPPQTLAAGAAALRAAGWAVTACDAQGAGLGLPQTAAQVAAKAPAIVGLLVSALTLAEDLEVLRRLQAAYPAARSPVAGRLCALDGRWAGCSGKPGESWRVPVGLPGMLAGA